MKLSNGIVVIYASSPIKKIIGDFYYEEILSMNPNILWEKTEMISGVNKSFFDEYFKDKDLANAFIIKEVIRYDTPKSLSDYGVAHNHGSI